MATYARAAQARELINDVAALNNSALSQITKLVDIRSRLTALSQAERDVVIAAVADQGYDASEIQSLLSKWNQVANTVTAQGLAAVSVPR